MNRSKEWVRWKSFIKPTTCYECFKRNCKIFSYEDLERIGEPKLHENGACQLEQLSAVFAGSATNFGTMGADWWLYYLHELSNYYISKAEAYKIGWENIKGNLAEIAPNHMIFGGVYKNKNNILPSKEGRIWYEADINYTGGYRNRQRVVFSNDGLIFVTYDHYETFIEVIGEGK